MTDSDSRVEELFILNGEDIQISGDRRALEKIMGMELPDAVIGALFGGIKGSRIDIAQDEKNVDVWTSNPWFETPLYFSVESDVAGISLTINDFFLAERAPATLGTRIIANLIFQAYSIPRFDSIMASATRFFVPKDGRQIREAGGYYFFPRLGFNGDPKNADDIIDIPKKIRGKKLLSIMQDPELRQWWKENGQTIDVSFKLKRKRSMRSLQNYLQEKKIATRNEHA